MAKNLFSGAAFIKAPCSSPGHCRISGHRSSPGHVWYGILWYLMTPLHGIACFYDVGFGARAVSRKTPIYFIILLYELNINLQCSPSPLFSSLMFPFSPFFVRSTCLGNLTTKEQCWNLIDLAFFPPAMALVFLMMSLARGIGVWSD